MLNPNCNSKPNFSESLEIARRNYSSEKKMLATDRGHKFSWTPEMMSLYRMSIFGSFLPYCPFSYCQMTRASLFPSMVMFKLEFYFHLLRLWRWWRKILFSTPRLLPTSNQNLSKIGNTKNLQIKINLNYCAEEFSLNHSIRACNWTLAKTKCTLMLSIKLKKNNNNCFCLKQD